MLYLIPYFVAISAVVNADIIAAVPTSSQDGERVYNIYLTSQWLIVFSSRAEACVNEESAIVRIHGLAEQMQNKVVDMKGQPTTLRPYKDLK